MRYINPRFTYLLTYLLIVSYQTRVASYVRQSSSDPTCRYVQSKISELPSRTVPTLNVEDFDFSSFYHRTSTDTSVLGLVQPPRVYYTERPSLFTTRLP